MGDRLTNELKQMQKDMESQRNGSAEATAVVEARDRFEAENRAQYEELASSADRLRIMEAKMHVLEASRQEDEQKLRDEHAAELVVLEHAAERCGVLTSEVDAQKDESHRAAEFM